jgi:hypothetical protein
MLSTCSRPVTEVEKSYCGVAFLYALEDIPVRHISKSTSFPHVLELITLKAVRKPLWAVVPRIPEWFMNTLQGISTGHEDL